MARNLKYSETHFGWKGIDKNLTRDKDRVAINMSRRTNLNHHCINLDKYIIMNATYAKQSI